MTIRTFATTCLIAFALMLAPGQPRPDAAESGSGNGITSDTVHYGKAFFRIVHIDLDKANLELFWRNPDTGAAFSDIASLKAWGASRGRRLVFAANAGIYDARHAPLGLHIQHGKTLVPLNTVHGDPAAGNFSLLPNGVFAVDKAGHAHVRTTNAWADHHAPARLATQSGPMLVIDGHINAKFNPKSTSAKWRSGVCARDNGATAVFAISEIPVNFFTFARLFQDRLECDNALYLDGTLSQIYVDGSQYGPPSFMIKPWVGMFGVFVPTTANDGQG